MQEPDQNLTRAVANTLWPHLRARAWLPNTSKRAYSPTGNPRNSDYNGTGGVPRTPLLSNTEVLARNDYIWASAHRNDTFLRQGFTVHILRRTHDQALATLPPRVIAAYDTACEHSESRRAFYQDTLPDGARYYRTNRHDPLITDDVALALETIALAADVALITPEVEDAFLGDEDVPDPDAILRAIERART